MQFGDHMNRLVEHIVSYLSYLNTALSLHTSVHLCRKALERLNGEDWQRLAVYNAHRHPYCTLVKNTKWDRCLAQQEEIHTQKTDGALCTVCHAGVYQYIRHIYKEGQPVGFVAVSGYRSNEPPPNMDPMLWEEYLNNDLPYTLCEAVIPPLCIMMEQLLTQSHRRPNEENAVLQYLNEYHADVTLDDVCAQFHKSRSHISHMFKTTYGVSIRTYCNQLKLDDARKLLLSTDRSVTDIALDTWFGDTSYFIHLFRQTYGTSPLRYRKTFR